MFQRLSRKGSFVEDSTLSTNLSAVVSVVLVLSTLTLPVEPEVDGAMLMFTTQLLNVNCPGVFWIDGGSMTCCSVFAYVRFCTDARTLDTARVWLVVVLSYSLRASIDLCPVRS